MFCFLSFLRFFGHGEACLFVLLGVPIRILFIMILSFPPSFSIPWVLKISFTYLLTPTADPPGDLPGKSLSDPTQARRPSLRDWTLPRPQPGPRAPFALSGNRSAHKDSSSSSVRLGSHPDPSFEVRHSRSRVVVRRGRGPGPPFGKSGGQG